MKVQKRGDALALAVALSDGEEVTLGPTDSAMCVEALKFYANGRLGDHALKVMRLPALALAALVGVAAVGGSTSTVVSSAPSQMSMVEVGKETVSQVVNLIDGHCFKPVPHATPESLAAQRFAIAYPDKDS